MASVGENATIKEFQSFIKLVYGPPNSKHFSVDDMLTNLERFIMRGLKGVRKKDAEKTRMNLLIALAWLGSLLNRLNIDVEEEAWSRFPYLCSYCASCPCVCKERKPESRQKVEADETKRPKTFREFQTMFGKIYPAERRSLEDAGIHLAEEMGEFAEAIFAYYATHEDKKFQHIALEAADLFSCFMAVFNSSGADAAKELSLFFPENCHACRKVPCSCSFSFILGYES